MKSDELTHFSRLFERYENYFQDSRLSLLIVENSLPDNIDESLIIVQSDSHCNYCPTDGMAYPFEHLVLKAINEKPHNSRIFRNNKIPYLLSGCVAILKEEPCTMCAMSLLHSRIDAVVYFKSNMAAGALGSICLLHVEVSLNHHFPVYQVIFE